MKSLNNILANVEVKQTIGNGNISIQNICFDSRICKTGDLFIATKGSAVDGHQFIDKSIELGAIAVVCELLPENINQSVCYILVDDSSKALGFIASNYFDNPSKKMKLVGVTGTNGKTTTATQLYHLFKKLGYKVGLLSTVRNYIDNKVVAATHTTPDAIQLNAMLNEMVAIGCEYCFMEVSSHSVVQHRISGLEFVGGIFSNITHDHLDYHKTFEEYLKAKKMFFDNLPQNAFVLTNSDDKNGKVMLQNTKATKYTYSLKTISDFKVKIIESGFEGMMLNIDGIDIWVNFIGQFNAYNLLAVISTAILLKQDKQEVLRLVSELVPVDGRFETIYSKEGIIAIVDYAHTPDAILNVLKTINDIRNGNEQVITVIGAGGNRDKTKRPVMAKVACELSNKVILTSDNPRNEKPEDILSDMQAGVEAQFRKKVITIVDRKEAIKAACAMVSKGDIILIAGKGHENYQEINGVKHHFDDKEVVKEILQ